LRQTSPRSKQKTTPLSGATATIPQLASCVTNSPPWGRAGPVRQKRGMFWQVLMQTWAEGVSAEQKDAVIGALPALRRIPEAASVTGGVDARVLPRVCRDAGGRADRADLARCVTGPRIIGLLRSDGRILAGQRAARWCAAARLGGPDGGGRWP
jgi:hypothetical protein